MSALDDVLEYHLDKANVAALTHKTAQAERLSATNAAARAELELLREAAWTMVEEGTRDGICEECGWARVRSHDADCVLARILRTDPKRARKMGLGWAL